MPFSKLSEDGASKEHPQKNQQTINSSNQINTNNNISACDIFNKEMTVILFTDLIKSKEFHAKNKSITIKARLKAMDEAARLVASKIDTVGINQKRLTSVLGDSQIGQFKTISEAIKAALIIRLYMLTGIGLDVRSGIGVGDQNLNFSNQFQLIPEDAGYYQAKKSLAEIRASEELGIRTVIKGFQEYKRPCQSINYYLSLQDRIVNEMTYSEKSVLLSSLIVKNDIQKIVYCSGIDQEKVLSILNNKAVSAIFELNFDD
jgi:hypothetical protein